MSPMQWDPLRELLELHQRFGRAAADQPESWTPAIDLYETDEEYVLLAELPGMTREQIDIVAGEGGLTLRGERRAERQAGADYHRLERGRGPFSRSFSFPQRIDVDAISADFRDGVLTVRVPKAPKPEARRVPVK